MLQAGVEIGEAAQRMIRQNLAADFGVLLCQQRLQPFYSRLGWSASNAPVVLHQDQRRIEWPHCCMLYAANAELPEKPGLDLDGPPF